METTKKKKKIINILSILVFKAVNVEMRMMKKKKKQTKKKNSRA